MQVLVYGATGTQARPLVEVLLRRGHQPRMLTRDPAKCGDLLAAGARAVKGDLDDYESLVAASRGVDAVAFMIPAFLQEPGRALQYAEAAMRAAAAGGARHVVWNTSGRFPDPGEKRASAAYMLALWEVLKAAALPLTVLAPTTYMENLLGPWTVQSIRRHDRVSYPVLADRPMGWIAAQDVGKLMAAALERPQLAGRVFRVSGVEAITGPQLAQIFSGALGRPLTYYAMSPTEMKAALEAAFGPGAGDDVAEEYALDQADPSPPKKHYDMLPVLQELPVTMTPISTWVAEKAALFT